MGGLLQALLAVRHRADLAGQAHFAEGDGVLRQRPVAQAGQHRQQHRQVGRRLLHADAADHVDEHVLVVGRHATVPVQHRQQHRQPVLFQAQGDPARVAQRALVHQRLHLHQQRPGAFAGDHHRAARRGARVRGQEDRRRVRHLAQALVAHREHAQLVDRAEAVLECAQHAEARTGFALEIQHRVDHVLQHARTGDAAFLGDVADQEHAGAGFLGVAGELGRRLAYLRHRAGRGGEQFGPDGLDRVDHQHPRPRRRRLFEDAFDAGLGQRLQRLQRQAQALRPRRHLGQRLLAGDVDAGQLPAQRAQHLQQQGRLADAWIAADQHHRALHQAAAEHAVQLTDAGQRAGLGGQRHRGQRRDTRRARGGAGVTGTLRAHRRLRRRRRRQHDLAERVPRAALGARALPLRMLGTAIGADIGGLGLGHAGSRLNT